MFDSADLERVALSEDGVAQAIDKLVKRRRIEVARPGPWHVGGRMTGSGWQFKRRRIEVARPDHPPKLPPITDEDRWAAAGEA